jgi:hypothetical protein
MTFAARKLTRIGSTLAALLIAAPMAAQKVPDTWYSERIISGDVPVHVEHLWSKGPKLRAEMVIAGHPILTLVDEERYTTIDLIRNTGVSIERSQLARRADATRSRPFGNEGSILQDAGGEKISEERIAGRACDLYRLTNEQGRQEACISRDENRLPLIVKVWRRQSGKEAVTRYLDWSPGLEIPDEFFEPDSGVAIERLSYEDYVSRASTEQIGPAPPLFRDLLHGTK